MSGMSQSWPGNLNLGLKLEPHLKLGRAQAEPAEAGKPVRGTVADAAAAANTDKGFRQVRSDFFINRMLTGGTAISGSPKLGDFSGS